MKQERTDAHLTKRQEKNLLKAAAASIPILYPNPEHSGCPEPAILRNLARRRIPLRETRDLVEHVATCAPCFEAYNQYRRRQRLAKSAARLTAAALCLLAIFLLWPRRHTIRPGNPQVANSSAARTIFSATLDYRKYSPSRSPVPDFDTLPPPHLRKAFLDLTILLPFGTDDGKYAIELRSPTGKTYAETTGTARWNGAAEVLKTTLDLRAIAPGAYKLAIRRDGASWHTYEVTLDEDK